jgi:HNH endonuclease
VLPILPPYEFTLYLLLVRRSRLVGEPCTRIGKRSIAAAMGKGTRASSGSYRHIGDKLAALERGGFITSGDTDRTGTEYTVSMPREVPIIRERLEIEARLLATDEDHVADPALRRALFERDDWRCRYCGARVDGGNSTLDHIVPQHAGGASSPENLATACLMCNSIKSGRTYEQAAPLLLERVARAARGDPAQPSLS